ncbi:MAG TPA: GTPase Era [Acidimicrobiales bacterium]|nr:GTPase Era [Acidimicrobiales bacterium]
MRSGFASVVGRPNVGKSTLVNALVGTKVTITATAPNTTRFNVRGVLHRPDAQVVFVDTPGLHRPRTPLGRRLNETATGSLADVDVLLAVVDATALIGPGDRLVLGRALQASAGEGPPSLIVVVNKVDRAQKVQVVERLASAAATVERLAEEAGRPALAGGVDYFPVAALTGEGVPALADAVVAGLEEGPAYYPRDMVTDTPEGLAVAELVREQLLVRAREELPHSIACRVTEWEWPRIRCEILVERDSQKAIVIGRRGEVLKEVGTAVREQLPPGAYLELFVRVEPRWQRREDALDELGY